MVDSVSHLVDLLLLSIYMRGCYSIGIVLPILTLCSVWHCRVDPGAMSGVHRKALCSSRLRGTLLMTTARAGCVVHGSFSLAHARWRTPRMSPREANRDSLFPSKLNPVYHCTANFRRDSADHSSLRLTQAFVHQRLCLEFVRLPWLELTSTVVHNELCTCNKRCLL